MAATQSEPANIRAFNWLTLKVLNDLYDAFPEPRNIEGLRFVISALFEVGTKSEEASYLSHFTATVQWLSSEGFLRYQSESQGNFKGMILTLKGLTILGYVPMSVRPFGEKKTLIIRTKEVLAKGAQGAASDAVKTILVKLFALAVSAAGS